MNRLVIAGSTLCIGCHTCEAICSETHRQHGLQSMPHLRVTLNEKESTSQLCCHYEDASCTTVCPVSATIRVDDAAQLNKSLCVSYKLCGIVCLFGAIEFSSGHLLDTPANVNTPKALPASPAPAHVSTLLNWVPGIRAIVVKYDLCSFDEQGPACVWMCLTKALHLMDNTDIARVSKYKRELTFNTDFGDFTLLQQAQSGKVK